MESEGWRERGGVRGWSTANRRELTDLPLTVRRHREKLWVEDDLADLGVLALGLLREPEGRGVWSVVSWAVHTLLD